MQVIETNLSIDKENNIRDHQSRIIEVVNWDTYCKAYIEYDGKSVLFYSKGMPGNTIQSNCKISNLEYDMIHLSCVISNKYFDTKRLAYVVFESIESNS